MTKRVDPVLKVLRGMRNLLTPKSAWVQAHEALDARGNPTVGASSEAVCWCLYGAFRRCRPLGGSDAVAEIAWDEIGKDRSLASSAYGAITWQDRPHRTHAQVLSLLDRTIKRRESALKAARTA